MINWEFSPHLDKDCTFRRKLQYFTLFKGKNNNCLFDGITFIGIKKHKIFYIAKSYYLSTKEKTIVDVSLCWDYRI